ncbi:hypothetical protein [Kutzneria kofuensis]|uniref:hypothetical protein n=1 Tax=Kutzneria kofuensis TaxID=103725 RepID=UPI0031E68B62
MTEEAGAPCSVRRWPSGSRPGRRPYDTWWPAPVDERWVQHLADLLATERSWQDQYTELIALGRAGGTFPSSQR